MTSFGHIVEFLESEDFKNALAEACKNFEILSEGDLQFFVCRKLFELFSATPSLRTKYRVNAQPFCRELKLYPDIAILRRRRRGPDQPVIVIELKEGHTFGAAVEQDCRKLRRYRGSIHVRRAYLIHVVHTGEVGQFLHKFKSHKKSIRNLFGIPVVIREQLGEEYEKWHTRRRDLAEAFGSRRLLKSKIGGSAA